MSRIVLAASAIITFILVWFGPLPTEWKSVKESIDALSTILIAVFTGTLWWATAGLKNFAQIQSQDMKEAILVTKKLARAAQKSADIAESSVRNFERPYVFLVNMKAHIMPTETNPEQTAIVFEFNLQNHGRTPAIVTEIEADIDIVGLAPKEPSHSKVSNFRRREIIGSGITSQKIERPLTINQVIGPHRAIALIYGFVRYNYTSGRHYKHGFGFHWSSEEGSFQASARYEAYNYDYETTAPPDAVPSTISD
jgi:hypothetical protein